MLTETTPNLLLPNLVTALPGPKAQEIIRRDQAVLSTSYTRCYPLVMKRGNGAVVEDVDGNQFLDFAAGIAVIATGHSHPRVVKAIQDQAGEFLHMSGTDFYYERMVRSPSVWQRSHPAECHVACTSAIQARRRWKPPSNSRVIIPAATSSSPFSAPFTGAPWARSRLPEAR